MDKVQLIKQILLTAQSRQKSYADKRRRDLVFTIGDKMFLRVSPMKGVMQFGKRGKLSPRFIGPYEILDRVGVVAYRLALSPELSFIHPVFHVSMLRKCISDSSQVLEAPTTQLDERLSYEEEPMAIVDRQIRKLRSKEIMFVKVLWRNHTVEEATWELQKDMQAKYPHLFQSTATTKLSTLSSTIQTQAAPQPIQIPRSIEDTLKKLLENQEKILKTQATLSAEWSHMARL
ncbi:PREDICTED: uncharacterized protein LOC109234749 [Nicotiana attenuata]|uniref:uncharacterized protein LOC109234749 n=1 Tax=Nicotiana attenuata TaxID=49451 RepID=UPI000904F9BB|nr:PREDICTED: uncharacterized protein LOC109234749 [Nicotiana attenuata]